MTDSNGNIKIKDNRLFNSDDTLRDSATVPENNPTPPIVEKSAPEPLHEIDFQTFILSLASSTQISMGIVANPITGAQSRDMAHAKQTIDILGMLEQKTLNNLTPEESGLMRNILFQLRMQFVELNKHESKK